MNITRIVVPVIFFGLAILSFVLTSNMSVNGVGVFVLLFFVILVPFYLYSYRGVDHRASPRQWPSDYEELRRTATEIGFNDMDNEIIRKYRASNRNDRVFFGKYRNHNVTIDEIDVGEESPIYRTRYRVDFENSQTILLSIRKSFPASFEYSSLEKFTQEIHLNDSHLKGLVIRGNREDEIKSILDASIRNRVMSIKDTFGKMEIGYGKPVGALKER